MQRNNTFMDAPWFIFTCHKAKAQTMLMGWRSLWSQTMHLITCEFFVKLVNRVFDSVNAFWLAILKICLMLMLHCFFFFTCWYVLILCKSLHVMRLWWDLIESSTPCSKSFEKRIGMGLSKNVQTNWGTVASNNMASYGYKPTCSPTCYAEPFLSGVSAEHGESQDQRTDGTMAISGIQLNSSHVQRIGALTRTIIIFNKEIL